MYLIKNTPQAGETLETLIQNDLVDLSLTDQDYLRDLARDITPKDLDFAPKYCLNMARSFLMRGYNVAVVLTSTEDLPMFSKMIKQTHSELVVI